MYKILDYSFNKAKELGVDIKPSTKKNKKIDVYKNGKYICSIGDSRYYDYPTYMVTKGNIFANERRLLYRIRHDKEKNKIGTAGYYALNILW